MMRGCALGMVFLGCSCSSSDSIQDQGEQEATQSTSTKEENSEGTDSQSSSDSFSTSTTSALDPRWIVQFVLNAGDWVNDSVNNENLKQLLDFHSESSLPLDVYLTDSMLQRYKTDSFNGETETILGQLKNDSNVSVSYHIRPPSPYYLDFDFIGLDQFSESELYNLLWDYEESELDMVWGVPTSHSGGYSYLKELLGYAPPCVGALASQPSQGTLLEIYATMGATFAVQHGTQTDLGETAGALYGRPEHVEIPLYSLVDSGLTAADAIEQQIAEQEGCEPGNEDCPEYIFISIIMHDFDFYSQGTSWWPAYYEDQEKTIPKTPPFDIDIEGVVELASDGRKNMIWQFYVDAAAYIQSQPDRFKAVQARDVVQMLMER